MKSKYTYSLSKKKLDMFIDEYPNVKLNILFEDQLNEGY